jgi:hypothetical protein
MSADISQPRALTGQAEVLATLERTLEHWLARAVEPAAIEAVTPADLARPLQTFEERLARLQAFLDQAGGDADRACAPLTAELEAMQHWFAALETARQHLAERTTAEVG